MARKRGSPVLIELMRGSAGKPGQPGSPGVDYPRLVGDPNLPGSPGRTPRPAGTVAAPAFGAETPPVVEAKPGQPEMPSAAANATAMRMHVASARHAGASTRLEELWRLIAQTSPRMWYTIAGGVVLVAVIWALAYSAGQSQQQSAEAKKRAQAMNGQVAPPLNPDAPVDPLNKPSGDGGVAPPPVPEPATPTNPPTNPPAGQTNPAAPLATVTLEPGLNYLVVANFKRFEDADEAAKYLSSKGLGVAVVAGRDMNPSAASSDRTVLILRGYTREQIRSGAADSERTGLVKQVQSLGRQWRAENRKAPTDFAQPYWDKYKK